MSNAEPSGETFLEFTREPPCREPKVQGRLDEELQFARIEHLSTDWNGRLTGHEVLRWPLSRVVFARRRRDLARQSLWDSGRAAHVRYERYHSIVRFKPSASVKLGCQPRRARAIEESKN